MSSSDEFDFEGLGKDFDPARVALEEMTRLMAQLYKGYRAQGLSVTEAAALTSHYWVTQVAQGSVQEDPEDDGV